MDIAAKRRIESVLVLLNERQRRLYLAAEVKSMGHGGLKAVHELTGVAMSTIILGQKELNAGATFEGDKVRKEGGGRDLITEKYENLKVEIEKIMEKPVLDNAGSILSWTTKSLRDMEGLLCERGFKVSHDVIGNLLREMGYSLRQNQKMLHFRGSRPDRDVQFRYVNQKCGEFIKNGQPIISVVAAEKEFFEDFRSVVVQYCKAIYEYGSVYGFPDEQAAKMAPYNVYEVNARLGFVNLGPLPDTVDFGVESILRWWQTLGRHVYCDAKKLCIVSDGGGRGGVWYKLWKKQLQVLANVSGLEVHVLYLPPGTSKWHMVGHELFCFINMSEEEGSPVLMKASVKSLGNVDVFDGLDKVCVRDDAKFELGLTVTDEELVGLNLVEDELYGHWNYVIHPQRF